MENITMTIDATYQSRVRSVCPEAGRVVLAGVKGWVDGTAVSIAPRSLSNAPVDPACTVQDDFGTTKDLAFPPFGEPPV